jgi:Ser/Thr protein kinase RdoA (MazF antagonist)
MRGGGEVTELRGSADTILPVVHSLLSPVALAEVVGAAYGLDEVRCRLIKATIREVYRVDARQGPAILIVYRHGRRTAAEIEAELDLLDFLAEQGSASGVVVAPGLRTTDGARLLALAAPEGVRFAVLFRFADGATPDRALEPEVAHRYGQMVARLHGLTDAWLATMPSASARAPLDTALLLDPSLEQIDGLLSRRPADLDAVRQAAAILSLRMAELPRTPPGFGLVHGDVIPSNILIGPGGALTLLDFDFCGPGWRAFDVATYLHVVGERRWPEASGQAFQAGYESVRPLADWEREAIPLFVAVREVFRLGNWGRRIAEWGTSALPDEALDRHLTRIADAVRLPG